MKLPGQAVLELRLEETENGMSELRQTARFLPFGLAGILYWYGILLFTSSYSTEC